MLLNETPNLVDNLKDLFLAPLNSFMNLFIIFFSNFFKWGFLIIGFIYFFIAIKIKRKADINENVLINVGNATRLKNIRKMGRIGSLTVFFISMLFFTKAIHYIFYLLIYSSESSMPTSILLEIFGMDHIYDGIYTLDDVYATDFELIKLFFIFLIGLGSFIALMFLSYGIYLLVFNGTIIQNVRNKPSGYIFIGIITIIAFGINPVFILTT